ncbi:MAG: hypothetical protein ABQ298_11940 [Puniceicoccaceae bacterium]
MIRPLRRRHLFFSVIMALGLPGLVIYGYLRGVQSVPMMVLPKFEHAEPSSYPLEVWHKAHLWKNFSDLNTRLLTNTTPEHPLAVELTFGGTLSNPDILLYWSPRSYSARSGIGESMHLLGTFTSNEPSIYPLPEVARHRDGFLILYSLGEDKVVSEAPLVNPLK